MGLLGDLDLGSLIYYDFDLLDLIEGFSFG